MWSENCEQLNTFHQYSYFSKLIGSFGPTFFFHVTCQIHSFRRHEHTSLWQCFFSIEKGIVVLVLPFCFPMLLFTYLTGELINCVTLQSMPEIMFVRILEFLIRKLQFDLLSTNGFTNLIKIESIESIMHYMIRNPNSETIPESHLSLSLRAKDVLVIKFSPFDIQFFNLSFQTFS